MVDCQICGNTGYVFRKTENGGLMARDCECMNKRRSIRRARESGLGELLERYTFETFSTEKAWQKNAKATAERYVEQPIGRWLVMCGTPGTGKTHLCTAVCKQFIDQCRDVRYMLWRDDAPKLKAAVNDRETYSSLIEPYKRADVLYIDDFFKGTVTDGDKNLAFELLNNRYNDSSKLTIISTERKISDIIALDEATGSRIAERSKGFNINTPVENWRMKS